ncbi:MAG: response regulator [Chloroflexota bacterium]
MSMQLLAGKKIFILEDDVNNLAVITSMLRRYGATIFFDSWGVETAQTIRAFLPIDVILLDIHLPGGVSGYDVYDAIKEIPELSGIPVVAVTASDPDREMRKAREKGFTGYISKPIRTKSFIKSILAVCNGEEVWGALT